MRLAFISAPVSGHLNPMIALGRRLQSRGHDVIFFNIADVASRVRNAGLGFVTYGEDAHPLGSAAKEWAKLAPMHGPEVLQCTMSELVPPLYASAFAELPALLRREAIDAAIVDIALAMVEVVPMALNLPYVHIWNVMHIHPTGLLPSPFLPGTFETGPEAQEKNLAGMRSFGETALPLLPMVAAFAERSGLSIDWSIPGVTTSQLAVISQTPRAFDFPVDDWPSNFHRTAPLTDEVGRSPVPFPWEKLTGEPLIFASLGTMLNNHLGHFAAILAGAARLPGTQLVLATGPNVDLHSLEPVPENAIIVQFAPQIALLRKASLCVTHAGLNTVLESLSAGVPLVALPIGFEQSGVSARVDYHRVGQSIPFEAVTPDRVAEAMARVFQDPEYRANAHRLGREIAALDGPGMAADIIEGVLQPDRKNANSAERALALTPTHQPPTSEA